MKWAVSSTVRALPEKSTSALVVIQKLRLFVRARLFKKSWSVARWLSVPVDSS